MDGEVNKTKYVVVVILGTAAISISTLMVFTSVMIVQNVLSIDNAIGRAAAFCITAFTMLLIFSILIKKSRILSYYGRSKFLTSPAERRKHPWIFQGIWLFIVGYIPAKFNMIAFEFLNVSISYTGLLIGMYVVLGIWSLSVVLGILSSMDKQPGG
jgi:hypothetical protein